MAVAAALSALRPPFGARYTRADTGADALAAPRFCAEPSQLGRLSGIARRAGEAWAPGGATTAPATTVDAAISSVVRLRFGMRLPSTRDGCRQRMGSRRRRGSR